MNSEQIEKILRNPPAIKTPGGLLERLTGEITLSREQTARADWVAPQSWLRRWIPAFSFVIIFLGCLVAIAVQTNVLSGLRQENDKLRAGQGDVDALRAQNADFQHLRNENQELDRLRKDNAELQQLREEVARLQTQAQGIAALRAENAQLRSAIVARRGASEQDNLSPDEQAKAERIKCVSNLKQIGLAARVWSTDNNYLYPTNFLCMSNYLGSWLMLRCASDKSRNIMSWDDVAAGDVSYVMDAPGITEEKPNVIFVECPIHHSICLVNGSVQQLSEKDWADHVKIVDGLKTFVP
jgi:hypothetical protein